MVSLTPRRHKNSNYLNSFHRGEAARRHSIQERPDQLYARGEQLGNLVGYYYISRGLRFTWKSLETETDDHRYNVTLVDNHWVLLKRGGRPTAVYVTKASKDEDDVTRAELRLPDDMSMTPHNVEKGLADAYYTRQLLDEVELVLASNEERGE